MTMRVIDETFLPENIICMIEKSETEKLLTVEILGFLCHSDFK